MSTILSVAAKVEPERKVPLRCSLCFAHFHHQQQEKQQQTSNEEEGKEEKEPNACLCLACEGIIQQEMSSPGQQILAQILA